MVICNTLRLKLASYAEFGKNEDTLNNEEGHNRNKLRNKQNLKEKKNFKIEDNPKKGNNLRNEACAYISVTETPVYRQCYNELGRNISCSSHSYLRLHTMYVVVVSLHVQIE